MEMYRAPVDLSQKALVPIDLFLSGELIFFFFCIELVVSVLLRPTATQAIAPTNTFCRFFFVHVQCVASSVSVSWH